jgi:radical SAM-linked protein
VFALSKIRLKFSKTGMGKYISHLDLLRTFTRSIHRAGLPVKYSQGFNPHQLITFSLPLALGVTSETEFVDIDFEDGINGDEVVESLNRNLPPDIKILKASMPICKANDIVSARYVITLMLNSQISEERIQEFFDKKSIPAVKKTKRGEKEINLREYIKSYRLTNLTKDAIVFDVILSSGGEANIKPDILVSKIYEFLGESSIQGFDIHRTEIFYADKDVIKVFC